MNLNKTVTVAFAACALSTAPAAAQFMATPVASNAFITFSGLDWAWAAPVPDGGGCCFGSGAAFISAFQASQGWRLPTAAELAAAPKATDFLFAGGNVPYSGVDGGSGAYFSATNGAYTGAGACATPWFSATYRHCDWQDGNGQPYGPWNGTPGAASFADQLYVRSGAAVVPEPASLVLMGTGLLGLFAVGRRRKVS